MPIFVETMPMSCCGEQDEQSEMSMEPDFLTIQTGFPGLLVEGKVVKLAVSQAQQAGTRYSALVGVICPHDPLLDPPLQRE